MKKLILILLSLVLCFSAFACTAEEDSSDTASTDSKAESAVSSLDNDTSDETSAADESSKGIVDNDDTSSSVSENISDDSSTPEIMPEFDINKVIYNPDEEHYAVEEGVCVVGFREVTHPGLSEYIENNNVEEDTWFCIGLDTFIEKENLDLYLDELGFVKNDVLTESFRQNEYDKSVVGYITKEMFQKLSEDNYAIDCMWIPKSCVDAGGCHKVTE